MPLVVSWVHAMYEWIFTSYFNIQISPSTVEPWSNIVHCTMVWEMLQVPPNFRPYLDFPWLNKETYRKYLALYPAHEEYSVKDNRFWRKTYHRENPCQFYQATHKEVERRVEKKKKKRKKGIERDFMSEVTDLPDLLRAALCRVDGLWWNLWFDSFYVCLLPRSSTKAREDELTTWAE